MDFLFGDFSAEETSIIQENVKMCSVTSAPSQPTSSSWAAIVHGKENNQEITGNHVKAVENEGTEVRNRDVSSCFRKAWESIDLLTPSPLRLRGLGNLGNTCFQNAVVQSLLACRPFLSLLKALDIPQDHDKLVLWKQLCLFLHQFEEPDLNSSLKKSGAYSKHNSTFYLPNYLIDSFGNFQKDMGQQEDAQEFLEFLLDTLHNEYTSSVSSTAQEKEDTSYAAQDEGWEEVGRKGLITVSSTNVINQVTSPISWLFRGTLRSELKKSGGQRVSATLEPVHCLHLNIKPPTIDSVEKSLEAFMAHEQLDCINATKRIIWEALPRVLTLHLKRFSYDPDIGAVKLHKYIHYPMELTIPQRLMSAKCREQVGQKDVSYRLYSVIAHHGRLISGGHYTCICQDSFEQWHLFDDSNVKLIHENEVQKEEAYVLFYFRT